MRRILSNMFLPGCSPENRRFTYAFVEAGLVKGEHMSVDGSFIQANADHHSRVPREQLAEVAKVNRTVREYLVELERENPVEAPVPQQEQVSTTDPDSTYATKGKPCVRLYCQRPRRGSRLLSVATVPMASILLFLSNCRRVSNLSHGHQFEKVSTASIMLDTNVTFLSGAIKRWRSKPTVGDMAIFRGEGFTEGEALLGMLRLEGPCAAVGDHLRLHQQNWNHALVVKAVKEIAQYERLAREILLVGVFHH